MTLPLVLAGLLLTAWGITAWASRTDVEVQDAAVQARWSSALWLMTAAGLAGVLVVASAQRIPPTIKRPTPPPPPARTSDTLGALAAGLAHELGQPLSAARVDIEGLHLLRQLGREPASEHRDRVLRRVGTCILAMTQTIEHLRALATEPAETVRHRLDLREAVGAVLAERDRWLVLTDTHLGWESPAEPCPALADPAGVRLVLVNLIRNAVEAVAGQDPQRRVVRVSVGPGPVMRVSDSGPGIPADLLPEVFSPFRSSKGPGRGVGLALAQASAHRMGGELSVSSEAGLGTVFTLRLPEAAP